MKNRIDDLEINNLKIKQNTDYFCFGIDAVLLSDFAKEIKNNSIVLDIGTGNGILPLLLSAKTKAKKIYGLEIQKELYSLATENITMNNLNELIEIVNGDIKNAKQIFSENMFDTIVTNPPYKKIGSGIVNDNEFVKIAKHEILCTLEDIIKNASFVLKNNGNIFMVHRPDRLVDILCLMRQYHIEPKNIRFVHSKIGSEPVLVLIKGIKNAKPFLKIDKPLYIYENNGEYTDEIYEIYGKEK
ncbi:MAG: tRNA1(Val) (adenine(37)-N6)-methyltransferase [Clostridiales bacterium]|nr:tRNA1(Val) (adenine(37)-N6)-methyltransferase [Clostridiales bacterium]